MIETEIKHHIKKNISSDEMMIMRGETNKITHPKLEHVVFDLDQNHTNREQAKHAQTDKHVHLGRFRNRVAEKGGKRNQETL